MRSVRAFVAAVLASALVGALLGVATPNAAATDDTFSPWSQQDRAAASTAKAQEGSRDFVRLPKQCLETSDKTPGHPIECNLNGKNRTKRPTLVLWGDSHMWMMIPAIKKAARGQNVNLRTFIMGACPPGDPRLSPAKRRGASECEKMNDRAMRFVKRLQRKGKDVRVILGSFWGIYLKALREEQRGEPTSINIESARLFAKISPRLFKWLGKNKIATDVDAQAAAVPRDEAECSRGEFPWRCSVKLRRAIFESDQTKRLLDNGFRKLRFKGHRPQLIDVNRSFCNRQKCRAKSRGGVLTWWDTLHLSATNSRTLDGYFKPVIAALKNQ